MSYHFKRSESVTDGVCRIAGEQIDRAIAEIDDGKLDGHETVHQVRKRCKKVRGLIRLVRPIAEQLYQSENTAFRDAAAPLSDIRDAQALLETFDELTQRYAEQLHTERFDAMRRQLMQRRDEIARDEGKLKERLNDFRQQMEQARERVGRWTLDEEEFRAVEAGLEKTYQRGRRAMERAYAKPTPENFHEWRKRVKYHGYHLRLLKPIWKPVLKKQEKGADRLGDLLGDDHDLAVFASTVQADPSSFGEQRDVQAILALLQGRRVELESLARPVGQRLFAEKPSRLADRFGAYWETWRREENRPAYLIKRMLPG